MAKWFGKVGYVESVETKRGVWTLKATELPYSGDLMSNSSQWTSSNKVNDDLKIANKISIIADPFAFSNFQSIKYAEFMGAMWEVSTAEVVYPRIILTLGGVYNGERPSTGTPD